MRVLFTAKLASLRSFFTYCIERDTLLRSIKIALVVGTILALINHEQDLLAGQFSWRWVAPTSYLFRWLPMGRRRANGSVTSRGIRQ